MLERLVQRAIERLDDMDEDGFAEVTDAEDDWFSHGWMRNLSSGPGCPISDPGGCEHDGREVEDGF